MAASEQVRSAGTWCSPPSESASTGPLVSVVVSCFNIERYVGACLESIDTQTYDHLHVVLVDDGSTDGTGAVLEQFAVGREGWQVLVKPNGGPSSARNAGLDVAEGEWLVFVDGDDVLEPRAVELLLNAAVASGVLLACGNHFVRSRGKDVAVWPIGESVRLLSQREAFESVLYHREIDVSAWGKIYARKLFESVRFPEGRIYEDTYVFDDVLAQVERVAYLTTPLYHYVMRSGSIVNDTWSGKQLQFLDAVDKFTNDVEDRYPDLIRGVRRRRVHARLSVLRYMERVESEDRNRRSDIVAYVRENGPAVLVDRQAPSRDKVGIVLVSVSPRLFFLFWRIYSMLRKDR
jgi:glycosyltransferase involved in cell wall biosynthesis